MVPNASQSCQESLLVEKWGSTISSTCNDVWSKCPISWENDLPGSSASEYDCNRTETLLFALFGIYFLNCMILFFSLYFSTRDECLKEKLERYGDNYEIWIYV